MKKETLIWDLSGDLKAYNSLLSKHEKSTIKTTQCPQQKERKYLQKPFIWQEWTDNNLRWNESEYGNVKDLRFPPNVIWTPDILMYNRWAIYEKNSIRFHNFTTCSLCEFERERSCPCLLQQCTIFTLIQFKVDWYFRYWNWCTLIIQLEFQFCLHCSSRFHQ